MQDYFRKTKIAIRFTTQAEYQQICSYFSTTPLALQHPNGLVSFYTYCPAKKTPTCKTITFTNENSGYWFLGYTIITFHEFSTLTTEKEQLYLQHKKP